MTLSPPPYQTLVDLDTAERRFFERMPWVFRGNLQDPGKLLPALVLDAQWHLARKTNRPVISLLCAMWNTESRHLEDLILSCRLQTWPYWELVLVDDGSSSQDHLPVAEKWQRTDARIKLIRSRHNGGISAGRNRAIEAAQGDFLGILDHDDVLHPSALDAFVRDLTFDPSSTFLFTNEVKIDDDLEQISDFFFKPKFDLGTLERTNYICHLAIMKRSLLDAARLEDGRWFRSEFDGAEDHDLFLRLAKQSQFVPKHLPVFSYFWRKAKASTACDIGAKPYVTDRAMKMLSENIAQRTSRFLAARPGNLSRGERLYSVRFASAPTAATMIVVKNIVDAKTTIECLDLLEAQKSQATISVWVMLSKTIGPDQRDLLEAWLKKSRKHSYHLWPVDREDSDVLGINELLDTTNPQPEYVLFLDAGIHLLDQTSIDALIGELAAHRDVAFVGLKVVDRSSGRLIHAGEPLWAFDAHLGLVNFDNVSGARDFCHDEHVAACISFACAATRFAVWKDLGGFDTSHYRANFFDAEICLRALQKGYVNFYLGTITAHQVLEQQRESQLDSALEEVFLADQISRTQVPLSELQFAYDLQVLGNVGFPNNSERWSKPLRYRVADRATALSKRYLAPLHVFLRRRLLKL